MVGRLVNRVLARWLGAERQQANAAEGESGQRGIKWFENRMDRCRLAEYLAGQQLASLRGDVVALPARATASSFDDSRLPGHRTKQPTEILGQLAPSRSVDPQSREQRSCRFWRGTTGDTQLFDVGPELGFA